MEEQRKAFESDRQKWQAEREQAEAAKYKPPEFYESGARNMLAQAETLEANGDYDKADELRATAKLAAKHAQDLRLNPPPPVKTDDQRQQQLEAERKEWGSKTAIDFPAIVKKEGSPEQAALNEFCKTNPGILGFDASGRQVILDPKALYFAARLVTAETAIAGLPALQKELGALRAKVKEFNEKSAPAGGGAVSGGTARKTAQNMSIEELEADLQHDAVNMGHL